MADQIIAVDAAGAAIKQRHEGFTAIGQDFVAIEKSMFAIALKDTLARLAVDDHVIGYVGHRLMAV